MVFDDMLYTSSTEITVPDYSQQRSNVHQGHICACQAPFWLYSVLQWLIVEGAEMRLAGKIAIVTGAGQGIGYGIASRFAQEGAHVVIAEINPATCEKAAEALSQRGSEALSYPVDVSDTAAVQQMIRDVVRRFGRVDILVNNAGVSEKASVLDITPERWDWMQRVNQRAVVFGTQAAARQMIAQLPDAVKRAGRADRSYGKIINISSIAGRRGRGDAVHYSVSKAAVIAITQSAAMALAPYNINVNAICPSVIPTAMWDELDRQRTAELGQPRGTYFRERLERIPLKRAGTVEEIGAIATFLCSSEGDYITGQTYNVDGGSEMN
jgi:NAD(P)-dependent dehydrogenase (short-subunit alcohol dehydrogenase family)